MVSRFFILPFGARKCAAKHKKRTKKRTNHETRVQIKIFKYFFLDFRLRLKSENQTVCKPQHFRPSELELRFAGSKAVIMHLHLNPYCFAPLSFGKFALNIFLLRFQLLPCRRLWRENLLPQGFRHVALQWNRQ
ncbi:hypothetical protein SDC9_195913 [bioreactor metagenome]|uniref:Uncharacterized protein n=1 Tax=bioreactor metagenome TaxID=1076179 RepID=A0A645IBK3_9ZZZZ